MPGAEVEYLTSYMGGLMVINLAIVTLLADGSGQPFTKQVLLDTLRPALKEADDTTTPAYEAVETFCNALDGDTEATADAYATIAEKMGENRKASEKPEDGRTARWPHWMTGIIKGGKDGDQAK